MCVRIVQSLQLTIDTQYFLDNSRWQGRQGFEGFQAARWLSEAARWLSEEAARQRPARGY